MIQSKNRIKVSTIADVAAAAGVSNSTVSRVLSGNAPIKASTREKVMEAIAALDFHPNAAARSLSGKRTYTVGVLVSDIGNPFYADVIKGIEDAALPQGYNLFLGNTNFDLERGSTLIRSFVDRRVDGVIVLFSRASEDWLTTLSSHDIPASIVDRDPALPPLEAVSIAVDFAPGIQAAVAHLIELGHRRFAHVSGPLSLHTSVRRRDIFLEALASQGIPAEEVKLVEGDFHIEGGRAATKILFEEDVWPTAIFAANDLMAIGVLAEARDRDLRIPQDLSVIGLDDIWQAAHSTPALSTVAMPRYEIGRLSMEKLLELLEEGMEDNRHISEGHVSTAMIHRSSTAPPRR